MARHPETGRDESDSERIDRNLQEMLGELRVALPGVQVLFAFLLVVPFNQRFVDVTSIQKTIYFATLLFTTASTVCSDSADRSPPARVPSQDKENIVRTGNRIVILGLAFLAVAMTGAVVFITDFLYGATTVWVVSIGAAGAFAAFWYAIPLRRLAAGTAANGGSGRSEPPARD